MKEKLLIILLILTYQTVLAQYQTHYISQHLGSVEHAESHDLDNDGDMDLICVSFQPVKVVWYENLENGIYSIQKVLFEGTEVLDFSFFEITEVSSINGIEVADINDDGLLDVLFSYNVGDGQQYLESRVGWKSNLGNGEFGDEQVFPGFTNAAYTIIAHDLDQDGDQDLALLTASSVWWSEHLTENTFAEAELIMGVGFLIENLEIADIDEDGDPDMVAGFNEDYEMIFYENLGDLEFSDGEIIYTSSQKEGIILLEDMDQDGDQDILFSKEDPGAISWLENTGGGAFDVSPNFVTSTFNKIISMHPGDIDADGDIDVVAGRYETGANFFFEVIWIPRSSSDAGFNSPVIITEDLSVPKDVVTADINNDGQLDIISASQDSKLSTYLYLGGGTFGSQNNVSIENDLIYSVHLADMNGDGLSDVLVSSRDDNKISWYPNIDGFNFAQQRIISLDALGAEYAETGDLDNDGDLDVIYASRDNDKYAWFENEEGEFNQEHIIYTASSFFNAVHIQAFDTDMDGDLDLLLDDGGLLLFENSGTGEFNLAQSINDNSTSALAFDDFNGDGWPDILAIVGSGLSWYPNLQDGTFGEAEVIIQPTGNVDHIKVADFDSDGHADILLSDFWPNNRLAWLRNQGDGNFELQEIITEGELFSSILAVDMDADGDLDAVGAYNFVNTDGVQWWENEAGEFADEPHQISEEANRAGGLIDFADLDSDGDIDILSGGYVRIENMVALYENNHFHPRKIEGSVYLDSNENGQRDSSEVGMPYWSVVSSPQSDFSYTFPNGNYFMTFSDSAGEYSLFPDLPEGWAVTSLPSAYEVIIDGEEYALDSLDFGVFTDSTLVKIEPHIAAGFPRCNSQVNFWLGVSNNGTTMPSGVVELELDESLEFYSSEVVPDSINGQSIYWHFDSLEYFATEYFNLTVQMPGVESIGVEMTSTFSVWETDDEGQVVYSNADSTQQVLVCAYDPNDKQVSPLGDGDQRYIAPDQELEYLIRFQNTGNDTAFTVVVVDRLAEELDLSTFEFLTSSHEVHVSVEQTGEAYFTFDNIMLPDSNVDYLGSQGYVLFSIHPNPSLLPNTEVENSAEIYFDLNPPIFTNTVLSTIECYIEPESIINGNADTLYSAISGEFTYLWFLNGLEIEGANADTLIIEENGEYTLELIDSNGCSATSEPFTVSNLSVPEHEAHAFSIYPNPADGFTTLRFNRSPEGLYDLTISNLLGQQVRSMTNLFGDILTIQRGNLDSGIYQITLKHSSTGQLIGVEQIVLK